jgi:hypothetical protein
MSLREQFEAWLKIDQPHMFAYNPMLFEDDKVLRKMWRAYQAGHAASGRDELLAALEAIIDDDTEFPSIYRKLSQNARAAIKKARGEA